MIRPDFPTLLDAVRTLPCSARVHVWMRVIDHAEHAPASELDALDAALAAWPARARNAWGGWYADVERVEHGGPWGDAYVQEVYRGLVTPSVPMWRLARHVGLWFGGVVGAPEIAALAAWPPLATITSVSLRACRSVEVADEIARFLAAPTTAHVREYTLALGGIEAWRVARVLAAIPREVERLWIHDIEVPECAQLLADVVADRPGLRGLAIYDCALGERGIRQLGERGSFDRIAELTLDRVGLDGRAVEQMATRPASGRLTELELGGVGLGLGGPAVAALARAGWLAAVESLSLPELAADGEALDQVLGGGQLSRLRHLRLRGGTFGAPEAASLRGRSASLPMLEHLEVGDTSLAAPERVWREEFTSARVRRFVDV